MVRGMRLGGRVMSLLDVLGRCCCSPKGGGGRMRMRQESMHGDGGQCRNVFV